jgi:glycine C-acetyltransferase
MPLDRISKILGAHVKSLQDAGTAKGHEAVVIQVLPPTRERGPRVLLEGQGQRQFIRLNSNSYLGMGLRHEVIKAEEEGSHEFGAGPGAVRFISGSYAPHVALERRLARFHGREGGMVFSSAYATILSTLVPLVTDGTVLVSDALNHNCIINAMRLARPLDKVVYPHLDLAALEKALREFQGKAKRAVVVTDGIFSMRGDHAPLDRIMELAREHDDRYEENVIVVVDDSHGVGAFGESGRGVEEYTQSGPVDVLVGTLGKAFGVNGGYVVSSAAVLAFLRETSPMYIYSNPITVGEARAALRSVEILDSAEGRHLLVRLRALTKRFKEGLIRIGIETLPGEHPVVPLMIRDTGKTRAMVKHLFENGVLVTGLAYPVVPRGDEEIRAQINADHTEGDVDHVLSLLASYVGQSA